MEEILTEFAKTKFFKNLCVKHDILFGFLSGSRITGVFDDNVSDYDLIFVTKNYSHTTLEIECAMYGEKRLHWYFWSLDFLQNTNKLECGFELFGIVQLWFLDKKFVFYGRDAPAITQFITIKHYLAKNASEKFLESFAKIRLFSNIDNYRIAYSKICVYAYISACIIQNLPIDIEFAKLLKTQKSNITDETFKKWKTIINQALNLLKKQKCKKTEVL